MVYTVFMRFLYHTRLLGISILFEQIMLMVTISICRNSALQKRAQAQHLQRPELHVPGVSNIKHIKNIKHKTTKNYQTQAQCNCGFVLCGLAAPVAQ